MPGGLREQAMSPYMMAMRGGVSLRSLATGLSVGLFGVRAAVHRWSARRDARTHSQQEYPEDSGLAAGDGHLRVADDAAGSTTDAFHWMSVKSTDLE